MSSAEVEKGQGPPAIVYKPRAHFVERNGSWVKAAALIMTTTTLPTLLALPSALAALGWTAGIIVILISCLGAFYCFIRLVEMNEAGGKRHFTYPGLSTAITGKRSFGISVQVLQYAVQWGVGIANTILAAQLMGVMFNTKCTDNCGDMTQTRWTLVAGAALVLLGLLPDFSERNLAIIISGSFTLIYCTCAIVLSFINNKHDTADYGYAGSTAHQVFYALNGVGIIFFSYGDTMYPELQSMLKPDGKTGSTIKPMKKGMYLAFSTTIPLLLMVAVVGYWAFGNGVADLLLTADMTPLALVGVVSVLAILQLIFSVIMFANPIFNWCETTLMKTCPKAKWMQHVPKPKTKVEIKSAGAGEVDQVAQEGEEDGSAEGTLVVVPSFLLMLLNRTFYAGTIVLFSIFFPFFGAIMALIGAVGLTPLTYLFPIYLWLTFNGDKLSKWNRWAHIAVATMYLIGGSLAAVGAIQNIVVSFSTFQLG